MNNSTCFLTTGNSAGLSSAGAGPGLFIPSRLRQMGWPDGYGKNNLLNSPESENFFETPALIAPNSVHLSPV